MTGVAADRGVTFGQRVRHVPIRRHVAVAAVAGDDDFPFHDAGIHTSKFTSESGVVVHVCLHPAKGRQTGQRCSRPRRREAASVDWFRANHDRISPASNNDLIACIRERVPHGPLVDSVWHSTVDAPLKKMSEMMAKVCDFGMDGFIYESRGR